MISNLSNNYKKTQKLTNISLFSIIRILSITMINLIYKYYFLPLYSYLHKNIKYNR